MTALSEGSAYIYKIYDEINSDSILINVNPTTSMNESNNTTNSANLLVYPNPISEEIIIETAGNNKLDFEIYNVLGESVFKGNLTNRAIINISKFASGLYIIKLENGKTFEFKKFIKN